MGRPKLSVDFAIVLRMRDTQNLGWSKMAEVYRKLTGEYVSRDTVKRRYYEAKHKTKSAIAADKAYEEIGNGGLSEKERR